jgi:uncharacterized repeat protein (TIGR04052 family)
MVLPLCVASLCLLTACERKEAVQVRFTVGPGAESIKRLQFYVSSVELLHGDGASQRLELTALPERQSDRVALIDLIGGPSDGNVLAGRVPRGTYTGIRFSIGVPFDLNHANPLTAGAPLNRAELFWNWQSGYKFLRLELTDDQHAGAFHLGSTGCSSASALRPPQLPCARPNAMRVELHGFDPARQSVQVRVADLVAALREGNQPACTGDYQTDRACFSGYVLTGLDVDTGLCVGGNGVCVSQRLFAVAP